MSFRGRLILFFALIVVVPMIALFLLLVGVARDARDGKADARLAAGYETAQVLYSDAAARGRRQARRAARDPRLVAAIEGGGRAAVRAAARRLAASRSIASLAVLDRRGRTVARAGVRDPVAVARVSLERGGARLAGLRVAARPARAYLRELRRLTGLHAALLAGSAAPVATLRLGRPLPRSGNVSLGGRELRVRTVSLREGSGSATRLALLGPVEPGGPIGSSPLMTALLAGFFAVAVAFALLIVRALQGEVAALLAGARRIGEGDFAHRVPVHGGDEFAGLAGEFNRMSERLAEHLALIDRQRRKLDDSVRRVGDAFASGLDRMALLETVVETVVGACDAGYGRAGAGPELAVRVEAGAAPAGPLAEAVAEAESRALAERAPVRVERGSGQALAQALESAGDGSERGAGVLTIARAGEPFSASERETFHYLANQAAVSLENAGLHELVARQAVTDGLTGLSNRRRFEEVLGREVERARRFDQPLGLVILDVDDFKRINDGYGHQQGDEVLRRVAGVLRSVSREVDEPARYGGEEMAVALLQADLERSHQVAERIRAGIEAAEIPLVDGPGAMRVTASLGAASMRGAAIDAGRLVAAADEALYRAKQAGKNRAERAAA